jgi:colicin import membrane protein
LAPRPGALRRRWQPPERSAPAFGLSLLVHGALFVAIAFAVRWKTAEPAGAVSVELWGGLPAAAPPAVAPPPPPPPAIVPAPPPPPAAKPAEIVEQKAEPPRKKVEPPKPEPKPALKKAEPVKKGPTPEELKRDAEARAAAAQAEKLRQDTLARMTAAAGTASPGPAGGAAGGGGLARGYESLVVGCIRPHIVFTVPDGLRAGQHVAEFEVQLAPTGEQLGTPRLLRASGLPQYDAAVERAIRRCDPFPRPREGTMPRALRLTFDPVETR